MKRVETGESTPMTKREWMTANKDKYDTPTDLANACVKALKCARGNVVKLARDVLGAQAETRMTKDVPTNGGICLSNVRISNHKPAEDAKRRFYSLKQGTGYPVAVLSREWGVSDETIRKHAKRYDALKYVEVGPGEWVPCVMHPDTAAQLSD